MRMERTRGIAMRVLDMDALAADAGTQLGCLLEVAHGKWALGEDSQGRVYVVCGEGVGWLVTDAAPLHVDLYTKPEGAISILPSYTAKFTRRELEPYVTTSFIDLADLVRVFGPRLEENFWGMHRRLSA